ncbi:MAG: hypothetical protein ABW101_09185 [Candidatus Thiodiazotropha sp.]
MNANKWLYFFSKFTLIDEILGFAYWALAIYGIFLIVGALNNAIVMVIVLGAYIVSVTLFYLFLSKKIKSFFKDDAG